MDLVRKRYAAASRIGIDLDTRNICTLLRVWYNARYVAQDDFPSGKIRRPTRRTVEVEQTKKGFHLRIKGSWTPEANLEIRRGLCDDPNRIQFDEERLRAGYLDGFDLLFDHNRELAFWPLSPPFWEGPR